MISDLIGVLYFVFHCTIRRSVDRRNNMLLQNKIQNHYRVVIRSEKNCWVTLALTQCTSDEFGCCSDEFGTRDAVLRKYGDMLTRAKNTHRFHNSLQHPLIFWKGQEGYNIDIPALNLTQR